MRRFTAGRLAREAGVHFETIRYYEKEGILPEPERSPSGYRLYSRQDVARLRFVKHAKQLGFTLAEIRELLSLRVDPHTNCDEVRRRAEEKIADIEEKIASLRRMERALQRLVLACGGRGATGECPILEALEQGEPS